MCFSFSGHDLCPCFGCALGLLALPLLLCCALFCSVSFVLCVPPCSASAQAVPWLCFVWAVRWVFHVWAASLSLLAALWFRLAFAAFCLHCLCSAVPVLSFCLGCSPGLRINSVFDCSFCVWLCQALSGLGLPALIVPCVFPCSASAQAVFWCASFHVFVALPFVCSFLPAGFALCCASALPVLWLLAWAVL